MSKYNKAREELVKMYIESLEQGEIPWHKTWKLRTPCNIVSNKNYRGINNLMLTYIAYKRGYNDNRWCTFEQMRKNKWKFKGEAKGQGVWVEYWTQYNVKEKKIYSFPAYEKVIKNEPERKDEFRIIDRCTVVFNCDLMEGVPKQKEIIEYNDANLSKTIDNIITNMDVAYIEKDSDPYYSILDDMVVIPHKKTFDNEYSYYATQLHELSHATGHESRLNRDMKNKFGTEEYAKEELRAEISSSFLIQKYGLEYDKKHLEEHKAYIQNWIKIIKDKSSELLKAISDADKIVAYLDDKSLEKNIENNQNNIELEMEYE